VGAVSTRSSYLDLEIGTIIRKCARGGSRKRSWERRKEERMSKGVRRWEKRGETRMHFCLHLPVTSEGTSCLGLLSPGGHHYCFTVKAACAGSSSSSLFPFNLTERAPSSLVHAWHLIERVWTSQTLYASSNRTQRKRCDHCSRINYMVMKVSCKIALSEMTARIFPAVDERKIVFILYYSLFFFRRGI